MSLLGIIFALIGGFIGGANWHAGGFLLGIIAGYSLGAVIQFGNKLKKLEQQLAQRVAPGPAIESTQAVQTPPSETESVTVTEPVTEPTPEAVQAPVDESTLYTPVTETQAVPLEQQTPDTESTLQAEAGWHTGQTSIDKLLGKIKSFFTDGNVVVKVGVLVLFVGVGFLMKYAAAHSMLPLPLRISGIALGGIALLIVGWRLRDSKRIYALLLQGGGIGVLYLTVFGAAKLYHLLPLGFAFVVMVLLVVLSGILAVLQNAKYLAFYGAAGGFLAPVLASTGSGSHIMLFSYYALLNLGIVGIAWYRSWRELNLLGFAFTFVIGALWGAKFYRPEYFANVEPFLILFFFMFVTIAVLFAFRQPPQFRGYVDTTLVFGVPIIVFGLQTALVKDMHYGLALSALGISTFYIALASSLWTRGPQGMRLLTEAFLAMGVVFASLAIPLALDGRWTSAVWALEGAAIVWVGVRQQRMLARVFGLILQAGAGLFYLRALDHGTHSMAVFNGVFLGALIVSLAGLFSSFYLYKFSERLRQWETSFHVPLLIWGLCWWFAAGVHEIHKYLDPKQLEVNMMLVFVSVSLLLAYFLMRKQDWKMLSYPILGQLYAMLICYWLVFAFRSTNPLSWFGWLSWPFAFATFYFFLYQLRDSVRMIVLRWQHIIGFWLLILFITWISVWLVHEWIPGRTWKTIMYEFTPALLMLFLLTRGRGLRWPVATHYDWYAGTAAVPIMFSLGLIALLMGLLHEGNPWPLSIYVPFVNPVDLVVGLILYLLVLWRIRVREISPESLRFLDSRNYLYVIAAGAFLWLNGIIARCVHHWFDVSHHMRSLLHSAIFQASISVIWTVTAMLIMFLASRRGQREGWFVGLGLFLITVAKLFLVDISDKNELTMIISLIVVAIVAIAFGYYLSPLPPKREESKS